MLSLDESALTFGGNAWFTPAYLKEIYTHKIPDASAAFRAGRIGKVKKPL